MSREIKAALTYSQNQELENLDNPYAKQDVDQVVTFIDNFVDTYQEYFEEEKINIFAVEAYPKEATQEAQVAYVLVNLTGQTITELNAHLSLTVQDFNVNFEETDWEVPSDFLGNWADGYAIMIIDSVPMKGSPTQMTYSINDLDLSVSNVTVRYA